MNQRVLTSIVVLAGLVVLGLALRRLGLLKEEHGKLFSTLVTQVTLPALIFTSLARADLHAQFVLLAGTLLVAEVACLVLAWGLGRWLRLSNPQLGTFMLVSAFGSSALLGFAVIAQVFPGDVDALGEAVTVSEIGVGPSLFILGVLIAAWFGGEGGNRAAAALGFFRSPICFALVTGVLWPWGAQPEILFQTLDVLAQANTFCVVLSVGLALHLEGMRAVALLAGLAALLKLVVQPVLVWAQVQGLHLAAVPQEVLILEACMPSAMLSVALAQRYGCDAPLASKLVLAGTVASAVSVVAMFSLLT